MTLTLRPLAARRAKIGSIGIYAPPRLLTNRDLEKIVETSDEWIYSRVGIRERHIVEKGMATSDMAVEAAKRCLDSRGIVASDVEAIIVATVTPDMLFPATACLVQDKLGAKGAWPMALAYMAYLAISASNPLLISSTGLLAVCAVWNEAVHPVGNKSSFRLKDLDAPTGNRTRRSAAPQMASSG